MALWEEGAGKAHSLFITSLNQLQPDTALYDFRQAIHAVLERVLSDVAYSRSLRILMHCIEFSDQQTPLNSFLMDRQADYMQVLTAAFGALREMAKVRSALSDDALASGLLSYLFGMIHHHLEPCGVIDLQRDGHALLDIYLDGVLVLS